MSNWTKNTCNTAVNITTYTDIKNPFTIPSDGYIQVSSENATSGVLRACIRSSNNQNIACIYMNITGP